MQTRQEEMEARVTKISAKMKKLKTTIPVILEEGSVNHLRIQPSKFDGTTPWATYDKQFEAAIRANQWNN